MILSGKGDGKTFWSPAGFGKDEESDINYVFKKTF